MQSFTTTRVFARSFAPLAAAVVLAAGSASAQGAQPATQQMKEEKPGLLQQATITPDAARKTALAQVPNGTIAEQEIEMENGKLAYSFDIKVPGKSGIEEVLVDAKTGAMIAHEHETPKQQAEERAKDAREARMKGKKGEKGEAGEKGEKGEKPEHQR